MNRHDMRALWRKRSIAQGWDGNVHIRMRREVTVLRFVERPFEIVDLRANVDAAGQGTAVLNAGKRGKTGKRQIDLGRRSHGSVVTDLQTEVRIEIGWIEQAHECCLGIGVR